MNKLLSLIALMTDCLWIKAQNGVECRRLANTAQADVKEGLKNGKNCDAAAKVGKIIAERAKAAGVEKVAFDRSGYRYHGRIKALAEAAREGGLQF